MSPRTGRPTDNPKPYKLTVRVDEESKLILDKYTEQEQVSQMEAIRRGIKRLEPDINKLSKVTATTQPQNKRYKYYSIYLRFWQCFNQQKGGILLCL